jgi:hypothetical protein
MVRNLPYSADGARDLGHTNGEQARSINRSLGATDAIMAETLLTAILSCFRRHWSLTDMIIRARGDAKCVAT